MIGVMAKTVQVRDVPDGVHAELRARAAGEGISLSDYARRELERAVERPRVADVLARATTRREGVRLDLLVGAVRAGRERE